MRLNKKEIKKMENPRDGLELQCTHQANNNNSYSKRR